MSGLGSKTYSDPLALASGHPGAEQFEIFVDSGQAAVLGGGDEVCQTPRAVPTPRAPRAVRTYVCACRAGVRAAIVSGSQRRMPEVHPRPLPCRGGGGSSAREALTTRRTLRWRRFTQPFVLVCTRPVCAVFGAPRTPQRLSTSSRAEATCKPTASRAIGRGVCAWRSHWRPRRAVCA